MDHVSIVVDDLQAATDFFVELGMEVEGAAHREVATCARPEPGHRAHR